MDRHLDLRAVAGHRLVDRVVDDLVDQVVQASGRGVADVHAGALADRLDPLEDADVGLVVVGPAVAAVGVPHRGFGRRVLGIQGHRGITSVSQGGRRGRGVGRSAQPSGRVDRADPEPDVEDRRPWRVSTERRQEVRFPEAREILQQAGMGHGHVQGPPADAAELGPPTIRLADRPVPGRFQLAEGLEPPIPPRGEQFAQDFPQGFRPPVLRVRARRHRDVHPFAGPAIRGLHERFIIIRPGVLHNNPGTR